MALNENMNRSNRLKELSGSNYEIADGQPDIRGWDIKDANGKRIGEVDELLFDEEARKVRYIILDLEGNTFDLEPRDVLVPIGLAQLHDKDDDVILPNVTAEQFRALPEYTKGNLGADTETQIRNAFAGVGGGALAGAALTANPNKGDGDDFYSHDHFNEDNLYRNRQKTTDDATSIPVIEENLQVGKREVETGGIRLRSRIVEREVEEKINLQEEHVQVERKAVNRPATAADLTEENIEVTEHTEVPVVNKETRVVEEISLVKDVTERDEVIQDTVKKTEVDIDKTDDLKTPRRKGKS